MKRNKKILLKQTNKSIKLLDWIQQYGGWWYLLCTPGDPNLTLSLTQTMIQSLAEQGLDELIFVLLMVHRKEPFMEHVFEYMLLDELNLRWAEDWDGIIKWLISFFD